MNMGKKVCVVTGTRAEYGLLYWVMKEIANDNDLDLQIIVTGMHLSSKFGMTYKQIEKDGFNIDFKINILVYPDTEIGISKSIGLGINKFADVFVNLRPDLLIVLGDRFEIFSATIAAMIAKIPVAHIHGGEATEGLFDESIRHSITKMSHLHFTSTEKYRDRVIQLGEQPSRVFNVGAVGIDNIIKLPLLSRKELEKSIKFNLSKYNLLITFHPVTLEKNTTKLQFENFLIALDELDETHLIFTKANADTEGHIINEMIDEFVSENGRSACAFVSMGQLKYLSTMKYMDGVIGNSSSGIIEAPSLKIGTINIGDRQKGREQSNSVINCRPTLDSIKNAFVTLRSDNYKEVLKSSRNPYERKAMPSVKIRKTIEKLQFPINTMKSFYDIELSNILPMN